MFMGGRDGVRERRLTRRRIAAPDSEDGTLIRRARTALDPC
jgi:hypothetical protein